MSSPIKCSCFHVIPMATLDRVRVTAVYQAIVIGGLMGVRQVLWVSRVCFLCLVRVVLRFLRFNTGKKLDRYSFKCRREMFTTAFRLLFWIWIFRVCWGWLSCILGLRRSHFLSVWRERIQRNLACSLLCLLLAEFTKSEAIRWRSAEIVVRVLNVGIFPGCIPASNSFCTVFFSLQIYSFERNKST